MRLLLFLLTIAAVSFAAPTAYTKNSMLLLDVGQKCLTAYSSPLGVVPNTSTAPKRPICATPGSGERVRFWFSWQFNTPAGSNTACAHPCEVYWDMRHGDRLYWYEFVDSSGNALSTRKLSSAGKVTAEPWSLQTSLVLPIEMVGFRGMTRQYQFTASTVPSGTISAWFQIHALDYQNKVLIQVNNAAWISLNDSTVTFLDRAPKFGGIGGGFRTMKIAVALVAGSLVTGTNIVRVKLGEGNDISNGFRVIKLNFFGPAMNMTNVVDSSNVATGTCSTTCDLGSTGAEIYVQNATSGGAALNGFKTLASTPTGTTFTYASSGVTDATYNRAAFNAAATVTAGYASTPTITARRSLITQAQFSTDDPSTWTAPANGVAATGLTLATTATLKDPAFFLREPVNGQLATKCTSCHAVGLRDLKVFGYSNYAIKIRSIFHDLDEQDGDDIAAYVRANSVTYCAGGRPYNPPYQPGPGLDAGAVGCWTVGAGIDAVLDKDADLVTNLLSMSFAASANINVRETQMPIQFADWNHMLPRVHPLDGYGSVFTSSALSARYTTIRSNLASTYANTSAYSSALNNMREWMESGSDVTGGYVQFYSPASNNVHGRQTSTSRWEVRRLYSVGQWAMVKSWELNHEFGLEQILTTAFPTTDEPRGWKNHNVFDFSPNLLQLDGTYEWNALTHDENTSRANGQLFHNYISQYWYNLQLVLNYHEGSTSMQRPQDWQYTYGFLSQWSCCINVSPIHGMHIFFLVKGLQLGYDNNGGPGNCPNSGDCFYANDISRILRNLSGLTYFSETAAADAVAILEKYTQALYDRYSTYTRADFATGQSPDGTDHGSTGINSPIIRNDSDGTYGSGIWFALPQLKYRGVSSGLINSFVDWAATIWTSHGQPSGWNELKTATCSPYQGDSVGLCTSNQ